MPAITLEQERFCSFLGRILSVEEMAKWLPWLGLDIEEIGADHVKVEFNPNRIDFCSHAGVARAFRGLMGWETGLPEYDVQDGNIALNVDPTVSEVRPHILGAVVRSLDLDEDAVAELMEMQEDLHWGVGRDRKKASIGVHDLDAVKPPFVYAAADPDLHKFVPLDKAEAMTLREILEKHEKGVAYKHLVDWAPKYPLIIDSNNRVLSMPPIINGELTRVNGNTKNVFLDVTGTDRKAVERSLNVLVTALADMNGSVESIQVVYPEQTVISPHLAVREMKLRVDYANELLGLELTETEAVNALRKSRLDARSSGGGLLEVSIPPYRIDILHEVDLVEEVAIGYGYFKLTPTRPSTVTTGKQHWANEAAERVRQIMTGFGFIEAMNFILTNETDQYQRMKRKVNNVVRLANPVSAEYSIARRDLLPGLLRNLMDNRHESYPQRVFEVSDVVYVEKKAETRSARRLHVAGVSSHPTANFTKMKSYADALLANLGVRKWQIREATHPSFLLGRAANIYVKRRKIGIVGEIHPEVLNNFELENPTSAFEMDLEWIAIYGQLNDACRSA